MIGHRYMDHIAGSATRHVAGHAGITGEARIVRMFPGCVLVAPVTDFTNGRTEGR